MNNRAFAPNEPQAQPALGKPLLIIAGIILISFTMRSPLTSVGPLVGLIREDLGISNGTTGLLTTVPLLTFAVLSPLAPKIGLRWGTERTLFAALLVLIAGIVLRSSGFVIALFAGTALIGAGIALCNVLLPGMVKQRFPSKMGLMTSVYTTAMNGCAALASGVSIPLAQGLHLGWQGSLAFWGIIIVIALVLWLPQTLRFGRPTAANSVSTTSSRKGMWRSLLAWQVTLFMGLQSFLFYCTIAWLPEILRQHGISTAHAGWMLSLVQFISLPASFLTPVLAARLSHQRLLAGVTGLLSLFGFAGLMMDGSLPLLFVCMTVLGLAQGASISLALMLIVIRAADVRQAAELSGMAQSVGYLLAAAGPMLVGWLFDISHSWTLSLVIFALISLFQSAAGIGAGRNQTV